MNESQNKDHRPLTFPQERLANVPCSRVECRYFVSKSNRNCGAKVDGSEAIKFCVMYRPKKDE